MPEINATLLLQLAAIVAAALVIFNQARIALGKNKADQPFIISMEKRFVPQDDYAKHVESVEVRMEGAKRSREKMHGEIKDLDKRTCRIEEQNKSQTDTLNLQGSEAREFYREQRKFNEKVLDRLSK